jgi:hypothetical protein
MAAKIARDSLHPFEHEPELTQRVVQRKQKPGKLNKVPILQRGARPLEQVTDLGGPVSDRL